MGRPSSGERPRRRRFRAHGGRGCHPRRTLRIIIWFISVGTLLIAMALGGSVLKRMPLSTSMLYLVVGFLLGHFGVGRLDPYTHAELLEHLTEVAVIISLFTAGLKLRAPLNDTR